MLFDPVGRRELVEEVFVSEGGGDGLLVPDLQRSQGVYGDLPGFYFLLLGQPLLHLLLELVLNLFRLVFILLVVLLLRPPSLLVISSPVPRGTGPMSTSPTNCTSITTSSTPTWVP